MNEPMKNKQGHNVVVEKPGVIAPKIIPSKFAKALVQIGEGVYKLDYRALERNKYAPWGRGSASGLPTS